MVTYGPWRSDSVPTWRATATARWATGTHRAWVSDPPFNQTNAWDADPRIDDAWNGTNGANPQASTQAAPAFWVNWNATTSSGAVLGSDSRWNQAWLTVQRSAASGTASSGTLPASVYDPATGTYTDPTVVGVEWQPQAAADSQRLTVELAAGAHRSSDPNPVAVKFATAAFGTPFDPGFLIVREMQGRTTLGTIPSGVNVGVFDSPPIPTSGDVAFAVGLLDWYSHTLTQPILPAGQTFLLDMSLPLDVTLEGLYAPQYRLVYADPAPPVTLTHLPPLRNVQRGDVFASAPRAVQNNSRQGSNRAIGFL